MPARDPVAEYLKDLIQTAAECLVLLPPPTAPPAEREAAIDKILAKMEPFVADTMRATLDLGWPVPDDPVDELLELVHDIKGARDVDAARLAQAIDDAKAFMTMPH